MSYQFNLEPSVREPLGLLSIAEVPEIDSAVYSTHAPYTQCDRSALLIGGVPTVDYQKFPAQIIASYDPESEELLAQTALSRPAKVASITGPNFRSFLNFDNEVNAIDLSITTDNLGLSFLDARNRSVGCEIEGGEGVLLFVANALKLRLCQKIVNDPNIILA